MIFVRITELVGGSKIFGLSKDIHGFVFYFKRFDEDEHTVTHFGIIMGPL